MPYEGITAVKEGAQEGGRGFHRKSFCRGPDADHLQGDPENSGLQGLRVPRAVGHDFARVGSVYKSTIGYTLVNTLTDI